jgi:hypothetical protein
MKRVNPLDRWFALDPSGQCGCQMCTLGRKRRIGASKSCFDEKDVRILYQVDDGLAIVGRWCCVCDESDLLSGTHREGLPELAEWNILDSMTCRIS